MYYMNIYNKTTLHNACVLLLMHLIYLSNYHTYILSQSHRLVPDLLAWGRSSWWSVSSKNWRGPPNWVPAGPSLVHCSPSLCHTTWRQTQWNCPTHTSKHLPHLMCGIPTPPCNILYSFDSYSNCGWRALCDSSLTATSYRRQQKVNHITTQGHKTDV